MAEEAPDKPQRARRWQRLRLLAPLRHRDFALLWLGMTVSLLGDGITIVALAWLAYTLSDSPSALASVGVALTLPTVLLLLVGGTVSDRVERRRLLLTASVAEAVAVALIGLLAVLGALHLWMMLVLVAVYGVGEAFFNPAFDAIVPTLVTAEDLTSATAMESFARPLAIQMIGPAVGGLLILLVGPGPGLLIDAATFLFAAGTLVAIRPPAPRPAAAAARSARREIAEGLRFIRSRPWLWATLLGASLSLLAYWGPYQVLLPFLIKNELHAGGGTFGVIRAAGGAGAMLMAVGMAQRGLPRRSVTFMFTAWGVQSLTLAGFAAAQRAWLFAALSLISGALSTVGNTTWGTLLNRLVPNELRGRVSSVDWMISLGLIPLSFALTAPLAAAIGVHTLLYVAAVAGCGAMVMFLAVPGVRDPEHALAGHPKAGPGDSAGSVRPEPR
jgi:DHA3 family tetracycline resistance protein-like MFS transporter